MTTSTRSTSECGNDPCQQPTYEPKCGSGTVRSDTGWQPPSTPLDARTRLLSSLIEQFGRDLADRHQRDRVLLTILEITEEVLLRSDELAGKVNGLTAVKTALETRLAEELDNRSEMTDRVSSLLHQVHDFDAVALAQRSYVETLERQNAKLTAEMRRRGINVEEVLHGPTKINTSSREVPATGLPPEQEKKLARSLIEEQFVSPEQANDLATEAAQARTLLESL